MKVFETACRKIVHEARMALIPPVLILIGYAVLGALLVWFIVR